MTLILLVTGPAQPGPARPDPTRPDPTRPGRKGKGGRKGKDRRREREGGTTGHRPGVKERKEKEREGDKNN